MFHILFFICMQHFETFHKVSFAAPDGNIEKQYETLMNETNENETKEENGRSAWKKKCFVFVKIQGFQTWHAFCSIFRHKEL